MLIQLPNNEWINPRDVQRVSIQDGHVIVRVAGDDVEIPKIADRSSEGPEYGLPQLSVYDQRDRIAEQINTACVVGGQRC